MAGPRCAELISRFDLTEIAEVDEPVTTSWPELQSWGEFSAMANQGVIEVKHSSGVARLRSLTTNRATVDIPPTIRTQVEEARSELHSTEDARRFAQRAVAERRGQPRFRQRLIEVYGGRCCVTSCDAPAALEAAHIAPYRGEHTNQLWNGLLLRADIHTLFDLFELTVDASTRRVHLCRQLQRTTFADLDGRRVAEPSSQAATPSADVLAIHNQMFDHVHVHRHSE